MKKRQTLIKNEFDISKIFNFDDKLFDGIFFTYSRSKIKSNIKAFIISKQKAKGDKDIGIRFTKLFGNVIITMNFQIIGDIQILIKDYVTIEDVLKCDFREYNPLKDVFIDGCKLGKMETAQDIIDSNLFDE